MTTLNFRDRPYAKKEKKNRVTCIREKAEMCVEKKNKNKKNNVLRNVYGAELMKSNRFYAKTGFLADY